MKFLSTCINGSYIVESEIFYDLRGSFERIFSANEFFEAGLKTEFTQNSISRNIQKYTLRGMHYQRQSKSEVKLVSCIKGSIYDVVVDMREESSSFKKWFGVILTNGEGRSVYVPEGCAHGFMTLADNSDVYYNITSDFDKELARGFRWNDAEIGIHWPNKPMVISDRDKQLPLFTVAVKEA
jgi:dTDP-4-dehydrorhamnose 3,5-epimerase